MQYLPYQLRVIDEKTKLDEKLGRLTRFFETPTFAGKGAGEQVRLMRQAVAMTVYSNILAERIAAFNSNEPPAHHPV